MIQIRQVTLAVIAMSVFSLSTLAQAVSVDDLKKDGPFEISSQAIQGSGFSRGTLYTPNQSGQYALAVVCPGFISPEASMTDIGKRMATHGFAVAVITTKTLFDFPASRAAQILAALKAASAVSTGPAAGKIDTARLIASGWSMGGGGALEAAAATPKLKAAIAYAPWNSSATKYRTITVPSAIIGGDIDSIAPVASHSQKFYDAIPAGTKKMLGVLKDSNHFFPNSASEPASQTNISWAKRFADDNAEYGQFLTGKDVNWASFASNGPF
jgi:dienelactone hydrolase